MADLKISQLTSLNQGDLAGNDQLAIVDVGSTETKKITSAALIAGGVTVVSDGTIPVSKLVDGTARQLLQTNAAGTNVEWTSNVDVPGTLDVTGAATFDAAVTIQGDLTVNGTTTTIDTANLAVEDKNIEIGKVASPTDVTADGGGITLKGTTDKTINWIDATDAWTFSEHVNIASGKEYRINGVKVLDGTSLGSAVVSSSLTSVGTIGTGVWQGTAITDTYLATITTAGKVSNSATTATNANTASAIVARDASGNFSAGTITAALTGAASSNVLKAGDTMTGALVVPLASASTPSLTFTGDLNTGIFSPGADQVAISTNGTQRVAIDSAGRLLLGTSTGILSPDSLGTNRNPRIQNAGTGLDTSAWANSIFNTSLNAGGLIHFTRASTTTIGDHAIVTNGSLIGTLQWSASDGVNYIRTAQISAAVDGVSGVDSMPGRLVFFTTPSGSAAPTERMRIDSSGRLGLGTSSPATLLHLSSATGSASPTPTELRIATTTNASDWSTTDPWGRISYYSADTSDTGPKIVAAIDAVATSANGGRGRLDFKLSAATTGTLTSRLVITEAGNVGIGTTSPAVPLEVAGQMRALNTVDLRLNPLISSNAGIVGTYSNHDLVFFQNSTERARIDSSGRLLVGTSSAAVGWGNLQSHTTSANAGICLNFANDNTPAIWSLGKSRGSLADTSVIVQANDALGSLRFVGTDGTGNLIRAAQINCEVDNAPGANDMPGRLVFSVTADGASSPTEALRISNNRAITVSDGGNVVLGTTTGTKIGTATTQKLGFYNATPVVQPAAVADATTAIDVITQLNDLLAKLRTLGIIAT